MKDDAPYTAALAGTLQPDILDLERLADLIDGPAKDVKTRPYWEKEKKREDKEVGCLHPLHPILSAMIRPNWAEAYVSKKDVLSTIHTPSPD